MRYEFNSSAMPSVIRRFILETKILVHNDIEYPYHICDSELGRTQGAPELFAFGQPFGLGISDACPEEFRELAVIHELEECIISGSKSEHICVDTLRNELELAEKRGIDMKKYIEFRTKFFSGLVEYYKGQENSPTNDHMFCKLTHSLNHLLAIKSKKKNSGKKRIKIK